MNSHIRPTTEELLNWIEGRAAAADAARIEAQLAAGDQALQQEVNWLRTFTGLREHLHFAAPPATVRQELENRFAAYAERKAQSAKPAADPQPGFLQRLVAALTFDSAAQLGVAGVRTAQIASARQLIYASNLAEIALNVGEAGPTGAFTILGQILPIPQVVSQGFVVQLFQNAEEVALATTDELGEFTFEGVQPGTYSIMLTYEETSILLTPIALQA